MENPRDIESHEGEGYPFVVKKIEELDFSSEGKTFKSLDVRLGFIKKVLTIVCIQLAFTIAICTIGLFNPKYFSFIMSPFGSFFTTFLFILNICTVIAISCYPSLAKTVPINYILLSAFTFSEAFLVSVVCAASDPKIVVISAVITLGFFYLKIQLFSFLNKEPIYKSTTFSKI